MSQFVLEDTDLQAKWSQARKQWKRAFTWQIVFLLLVSFLSAYVFEAQDHKNPILYSFAKATTYGLFVLLPTMWFTYHCAYKKVGTGVLTVICISWLMSVFKFLSLAIFFSDLLVLLVLVVILAPSTWFTLASRQLAKMNKLARHQLAAQSCQFQAALARFSAAGTAQLDQIYQEELSKCDPLLINELADSYKEHMMKRHGS